MYRLWNCLVNGWELEIDISNLHVPSSEVWQGIHWKVKVCFVLPKGATSTPKSCCHSVAKKPLLEGILSPCEKCPPQTIFTSEYCPSRQKCTSENCPPLVNNVPPSVTRCMRTTFKNTCRLVTVHVHSSIQQAKHPV